MDLQDILEDFSEHIDFERLEKIRQFMQQMKEKNGKVSLGNNNLEQEDYNAIYDMLLLTREIEKYI